MNDAAGRQAGPPTLLVPVTNCSSSARSCLSMAASTSQNQRMTGELGTPRSILKPLYSVLALQVSNARLVFNQSVVCKKGCVQGYEQLC